MKLYAPRYYKEFVCIADRCRHSCCIGWEIDVDSSAMEKYAALGEGYGDVIKASIESDPTPHFGLCENERCPHLDERGLCRIITNLGEGYLCEICREHPRFYHNAAHGREVGLGLSCEEACRIILGSDNYTEMIEIGEAEGTEPDFDSLPHRKRIYSILSDRSVAYPERLRKIYEEYDISPAIRTDAEWREILASLEYLNAEHGEIFTCYSSELATSEKHQMMLERALAYFVFRHCTPACDEDDLRAALGFALFCERLLSSVVDAGYDPYDLARIISEELEYSEENTETLKFEFLF